MKRDFLTLLDYTADELTELLRFAVRLKKERNAGIKHDHYLAGKSIGLIFEKSSTRTRVSFDVGVYELGGHPMFLSSRDIQLGRGESIKDTARVLSRYLHGIMIRTFGQDKVIELAKHSSIPVINGLTDEFHPCQIMADIMTFMEKFGEIKKIKVAYIGDGNNIAHSWLNGSARLGFDLTIASPKGFEPNKFFTETAIAEAKLSGAKISIVNDPKEAVKDANVVTTDVWASMGQEEEANKRIKAFAGYQVSRELMATASKDAIFLHCLPAHLGEEVAEEVFESPASAVFDEAENRLHVQKAIMATLIK